MASTLSFIPFGQHDWIPITVVGWTLNYEMFFYLCFAIALVWPMRLALPALTATFVGFVILWKMNLTIGPFRFWFNPMILEFLLGVWLGAAYVAGLRLPSWACWQVAGLGIGIFAALSAHGYYYGAVDPTGQRWFMWGIPALLIVAGGALSSTPGRGGWPVAFVILLGDASYCLYLTHGLIIPFVSVWSWGPLLDTGLYLAQVFHAATDPANLEHYALMGRIPVVWGALIVSSILVHLCIEWPLTRILRRLFLERSDVARPSVPAPVPVPVARY